MNTENSKFLYEKAIRGYEFIVQRYKDWMNLYAIFVGAFFIAYYTTTDKPKLSLVIIILGLVASVCWFFSFCGYYHWLLSWNTILHYHESLFLRDNKLSNEYRIYSLYYKQPKKDLYSTQKTTKIFLYFVISGWIYLLISSVSEPKITQILENFGGCLFLKRIPYCFVCPYSYTFLVIILTLYILYIFKFSKYLVSDVESMYELKKEKVYKYSVKENHIGILPPNKTVL